MNISSKNYPKGVNEFEMADIDLAPSQTVKVPHVKFAPASLECKLWKTLTLPEKPDGSSTTMIMGVVTGMNIDEGVIKNGKINLFFKRRTFIFFRSSAFAKPGIRDDLPLVFLSKAARKAK